MDHAVRLVGVGRTCSGWFCTEESFRVGAFGTLGNTLEFWYEPPRRMQWTALAGGVRELLGAHEFAPAADGQLGDLTFPHRNVDDMYANLSFI